MAVNLRHKRWFYINSGTQLSETNSTFSFEINLPDNQNLDRIVLTQALIPLTYYVIGTNENVFILNEDGLDLTITVPPGNYNTINFPKVIGPLLTAASANGITYTVTYPVTDNEAQTGKFTYTADSTAVPIYFAFPDNEDLAIRFGFDRGDTDYFTPNGASSILVSQNVVDMTAENCVVIHSNLVQDEAGQDVLQEIYQNNTSPMQNITYLCPDPLAYSKRLSSSKIRLATFSLTDEFNFPIYLNGLDCAFTIMIYEDPKPWTLLEGAFNSLSSLGGKILNRLTPEVEKIKEENYNEN